MLKALKILKGNRGIALLITISVTTILVAAALEYNRRARFAIISTAAVRDHLTMSNMADSGVYAAMALLVKDRSESDFDSLQEDWANPEKIDEILQEISFEKGKLSELADKKKNSTAVVNGKHVTSPAKELDSKYLQESLFLPFYLVSFYLSF